MYWCKECGCEVRDPRYVKVEEVHWEVDTRRIEEMETVVCPHCGHELDEAGKCDICGEPCDPDENFCEWCSSNMLVEWNHMIKSLAVVLNVSEKDMANHFSNWLAESEGL